MTPPFAAGVGAALGRLQHDRRVPERARERAAHSTHNAAALASGSGAVVAGVAAHGEAGGGVRRRDGVRHPRGAAPPRKTEVELAQLAPAVALLVHRSLSDEARRTLESARALAAHCAHGRLQDPVLLGGDGAAVAMSPHVVDAPAAAQTGTPRSRRRASRTTTTTRARCSGSGPKHRARTPRPASARAVAVAAAQLRARAQSLGVAASVLAGVGTPAPARRRRGRRARGSTAPASPRQSFMSPRAAMAPRRRRSARRARSRPAGCGRRRRRRPRSSRSSRRARARRRRSGGRRRTRSSSCRSSGSTRT